jgi:hypothetical protein
VTLLVCFLQKGMQLFKIQNPKKTNMKKLFFPLAILGCISAMVSCKKEVVSNEMAASISSQNISNEAVAAEGTHFGSLISDGSVDNKITVSDKFGVTYVRSAVTVKDFQGKDPGVDKYLNSGFKVVLNLNWDHVADGRGNRTPVPFPTDMVKYRKLLGAVLDKYKPEVAVIENEPTTDDFHSGPIENYIAELAVAIDVCHSKGVKVADGAIHVGNVQKVMAGTRLDGNALEVKKLIAAYATLNLDFVNVHTQGTGDSYPDGQLQKVADYLRAQTGKPVMSNEFTVKSNSTNLIKQMVDGFKAGGYKYAIVRSGDSAGGAVPLHSGTNLLANGIAYRDEIK